MFLFTINQRENTEQNNFSRGSKCGFNLTNRYNIEASLLSFDHVLYVTVESFRV